MIEIKTILYPTDFSEHAHHAMQYAVEMARQFKAKVIVHHAIPSPLMTVGYEIAVDVKAIDMESREYAQKRVGEIRNEIKGQGIECEELLEVGTAFVEIVRAARAKDVDLIIMATHGWGPFKHMLLGSTAEKVVRKAPCPVLTVRSPEHEFIHPGA